MMRRFRHWLIAWFATRERGRVPLAALSLSSGAGLSALLLLAAVHASHENRVTMYRDAAEAAVAEQQYDDAELFLRKAIYSGDRSQDTVYRLGLVAEHAGDPDLARHRMQSIAPIDRRGFGKAHLWLARQISSQDTPIDDVALEHLTHHLQCAIRDSPDDSSAHALLAQVFLATNEPGLALPHLRDAVPEHPEVAVSMARICAAAGNRSQAISVGQRAVEQYSQRLEANPHDVQSRLKLAELKTFLEHWSDAETLLRQGLALTNDQRLRVALARVYTFRADLYQQQQPGSIAEQLTLLESAVQLLPQDGELARRLTNFITLDVPLSETAVQGVQQYWTDVLEGGPDRQDARLWLAKTALRTNDVRVAIEHFESIVDEKPELLLPLARLYRLQNETDRARERGREAERVFAEQASTDSDNLQARLLWAEGKAFLNDWEGSVAVLNDGLASAEITPQHRGQLELALSKVYTAWARQPGPSFNDKPLSSETAPAEVDASALSLNEQNTPGPDESQRRIQALSRAIELAPGNLTAFEQLGEIIENGSARDAESAQEAIEHLLASGKSTGLGHMILGGVASGRNDLSSARLHFEQAYRAMPEMPECMNNLAWILVRSEPVELDRALELIDSAIERQPSRLEFLETRGEAYIHLKRFSDAINDLEAVLTAFPDRTRTHELLAMAYEQSGRNAIAQKHHELRQLPRTSRDND